MKEKGKVRGVTEKVLWRGAERALSSRPVKEERVNGVTDSLGHALHIPRCLQPRKEEGRGLSPPTFIGLSA